MIDDLRGVSEINRLREALEACMWAAVSQRYNIAGLRAFIKQQAAWGLRLGSEQPKLLSSLPTPQDEERPWPLADSKKAG